MKISVDKTLYYWYSKAYSNYKSWNVQLSLLWDPCFSFWIAFNPLEKMGIRNFNIELFGLFIFGIEQTYEQDHAGFRLELRILFLDFEYENKDVRHWDYDKDSWEYHENEIEEMNINYNLRKTW